NRHYICYTDIGFAISEDGGRSWWPNGYVSGTPWRNTTYDLAFDPAEKGLVWAAMSNVHDIPHSTHAWADIHTRGPGGVCVSRDGGANWEVSSDGLPAAPCTSIEIDPTSPKGARTLYATIYGHGVYKSTDGAATWRRSSNGLPLDRNNHTLLVRRHGDGTLFCSISAARERRAQRRYHRGGLFRSTDGGRSWTDITAGQPFYWCNGFDFDPTNSRVLYLAAANNRENPREGGIWKTTDGGATWRQLLGPDDFAGKAGPEPDTVEGMFVTVDPRDAESVYLGTTAHGLWYTHDAGETWRQFDGIPFGSIHRVTFDPDDHDRVYVTTFGGGVWRGPRP
ncbi:MAG: WD40/YVTN/BNR-like repeat-containing protein, partial [Armatimonadota bacterium]